MECQVTSCWLSPLTVADALQPDVGSSLSFEERWCDLEVLRVGSKALEIELCSTNVCPVPSATSVSGHDEQPRGSVLIDSPVLTSTDFRTRFRTRRGGICFLTVNVILPYGHERRGGPSHAGCASVD